MTRGSTLTVLAVTVALTAAALVCSPAMAVRTCLPLAFIPIWTQQ